MLCAAYFSNAAAANLPPVKRREIENLTDTCRLN